jgi:hypothetical protein
MLVGDNWHGIEIRSATEELGEGRRFTRVRARLRATGVALSAVAATTLWSALAVWQDVHSKMVPRPRCQPGPST